jgi:hypothetical protein
MLPPQARLDPKGYYARLGVEPAASHSAVVTAFRAKARLLHPDVAQTGNTEAFVAAKLAYDVLSHPERRADYDRHAREAAQADGEPNILRRPVVRPTVFRPTVFRPQPQAAAPAQEEEIAGPPLAVWVALGAFLVLCIYQVAAHLLAPAPPIAPVIRPNAATIAPLPPSAQRSMLYGPAPLRLAGNPNFYVLPAGNATILWRRDAERNVLVPLGRLPPFSAVQAIRLIRETGMLEVLVNDQGHGFISADHLIPGNAEAARLAYCGYNSGPAPGDGETLQRRGSGGAGLALENQSAQPAVVKLRDQSGAVVLAVFLAPGGRAVLGDLPEGVYRLDFAIGELWSRACSTFAAGMRAWRMDAPLRLPASAPIVLDRDGSMPDASAISDQVFQRN